MPLNFNKAAFVRSAGEPKDFLRDGLPQFAFAGRSNVGKSSVINRLVGRKNLAYVGASPGKTRTVFPGLSAGSSSVKVSVHRATTATATLMALI